MPEPPTPGVNGQVVGSPALQASMSMLSLEPAASTSSWLASIASAGSFCLFCENGLDGLPTETSRSPGAATAPGTDSASAAPTAPSSQRFLPMNTPLPTEDLASSTYPLRAQVQTGSRRQGAGAGQWRASPVAPRRAQSCAAELSSPRSALWFGRDARARGDSTPRPAPVLRLVLLERLVLRRRLAAALDDAGKRLVAGVPDLAHRQRDLPIVAVVEHVCDPLLRLEVELAEWSL